MPETRTHVLIVGSGGREHALASAVARSPRCGRICVAPGNAGTREVAENIPIDPTDFDGLVKLARDRGIGLTIVGPEASLCAGIVDRFQKEGLRIFGPTRAAARIEGDKAYAKALMRAADVPTADARVFTRFEDARTYVLTRSEGLVVKASGLAAGKGVVVCDTPAQTVLTLEKFMIERPFGDAADTVIVEERLQGEELSVLALVSGRAICILETAQDHKRLGDGDAGPNTGGMGAFSPAPCATPKVLRAVERDVLLPIVDALARESHPYQGVLYAGLMLTPAGPKVLEFNCRFGDPEAQAILPRIRSDFLDLIEAVVDGRLEEVDLQWDDGAAVCVVLASRGYPGPVEDGKVIDGLEAARRVPGVQVYHAGTRPLEHRILSKGGRVLAVTGLGGNHEEARRRAYEAVACIHFDGMQYRTDIGDRALQTAGACGGGGSAG